MNTLLPAAASTLAQAHWGIGGQIRVLPSYLDQNFRIRGEHGEYVLKVAHPSWKREDLDLENHAMMALAEREPGLPWPRVQFTPGGEHLLTLPITGESCHVRMLSFVSGVTYAEARVQEMPEAERRRLQRELGAIVARLTHGLTSLRHPAANRSHPWNLLRLSELHDEVAHMGDAALRDAVCRQMQIFDQGLSGWRRHLPMSVVHNDANDHNVIAAEDDGGYLHVCSVIDFGDMCTSWRVAELAIACTYAMQHDDDPVACARAMVDGYLSRVPLSRVELEALQTLIGARACQSILMAERAHRGQPDNAYILVSRQGMQRLLLMLAEIAPDAIIAPFY